MTQPDDHLAALLDRAAAQVQVSPPPTQRILASGRHAQRRQTITRFTLASVAAIIVVAGATAGISAGDGGWAGRAVPAGPATSAPSLEPLDTTLEGTWIVTALAGGEPSPSVMSRYVKGRVILTFDRGTMAADTGCNTTSAGYEQTGDQGQDIVFRDALTTLIGCPEGEPHVQYPLSMVRHVSGAGNTRYLLSDDEQVLFELTRR
jgi:hypothetical protein